MKRPMFALTTGAALVASLLVGGYGVAQANTDDTTQTAAVCTGGEQVMLRAAAPAPANAAVNCTPAEGEAQAGLPAQEVAQPATPDRAQAAIGAASEAAAVSQATTPKDANGQIAIASQPGHVSQAPTAKDAQGQIDLAAAPGHTSTAVDTK